MMKIGICDDRMDEVRSLSGMLQRIAERMGLNAEICEFDDGEELLQEIRTYGHMDILFLDIEMEGKNGIETAEIIRETDFRTILIFVSAYDQYCRQMIEVQPFAFVKKPALEKDMERLMEKILRAMSVKNERFMFSCQRHRYSIPLHQIMYFESIGRQICIHCTHENYFFYGKLNEVEKKIEQSQIRFARAQISYLVNLSYVKEWDYDKVIMDDGTEIFISKKYRKEMKLHYMGVLESK